MWQDILPYQCMHILNKPKPYNPSKVKLVRSPECIQVLKELFDGCCVEQVTPDFIILNKSILFVPLALRKFQIK